MVTSSMSRISVGSFVGSFMGSTSKTVGPLAGAPIQIVGAFASNAEGLAAISWSEGNNIDTEDAGPNMGDAVIGARDRRGATVGEPFLL